MPHYRNESTQGYSYFCSFKYHNPPRHNNLSVTGTSLGLVHQHHVHSLSFYVCLLVQMSFQFFRCQFAKRVFPFNWRNLNHLFTSTKSIIPQTITNRKLRTLRSPFIYAGVAENFTARSGAMDKTIGNVDQALFSA